MCGFCGILLDKGSVQEDLLGKMREKMKHRGPDEGANYLEGPFGLAFRRLKVIDLVTGQQPISNERGNLKLAFNGEIYNHVALREKLQHKGHRFKSRSDAEVLLHLYEDEERNCLSFLQGMFAFVLWDREKEVLFGARDRFGIKPFYYLEQPGLLAFASEIKALAELPTFPRVVDEDSFADYLTYQYVPEPRTMFKEVYRLPPAHYFYKKKGQPVQLSRYWQAHFKPEKKPLSHFLEGIRHKLRKSVQLHLSSDVPRGAFLSSGVDSAIIAALIREEEPLFTFSVGYAEENYSELAGARETAEYLETEHHEYIIEPEEYLRRLPALVWHFDEPVADPAAISLFFVARLARQKVTVVLSGEGADEVFGGYGIYKEPLALSPINRIPAPLKGPLFQVGNLLPAGVPGKNYLLRAQRPLEKRFLGNAFIFTQEEKRALLHSEQNPSPFRLTEPLYRQSAGLDDVSRMQYIDLHTWMPGDILVKADKMTMASSLELRVPYLDHILFEFAAAIPMKYKVKGKVTKLALREAFKDILPPAAINRPKRGFPVPTRKWLKRPDFRRFFLELLAGQGGERFNKETVRQLYRAHLNGSVDASRKLWTILIFLLWHETFIRQNGVTP